MKFAFNNPLKHHTVNSLNLLYSSCTVPISTQQVHSHASNVDSPLFRNLKVQCNSNKDGRLSPVVFFHMIQQTGFLQTVNMNWLNNMLV